MAFAMVATGALLAPIIGALVAVPFAIIAVAGRTISDGWLFSLFARPKDRHVGELRSLVGFALAATGLALLTSLAGLPHSVFVATLLIIGYGNLFEQAVRAASDRRIAPIAGFAVGGTLATLGGFFVLELLTGSAVDATTAVFLGLAGSLTAVLVRTISFGRDDQLTIAAIGITLWVLVSLELSVEPFSLGAAVLVSSGVGYLSWRLDAASITGMLSGVLLSLASLVLGGIGWFGVLITFFGVGGFASKYQYLEKKAIGVAEANEGARGSRNVLGNAGVALLAIIGYAAADGLAFDAVAFQFAFVGSLAAAMSDTLSSEIGVLYGPPRLITTFERVETGTDGGVTLEGVLAGLGGSVLIASIAWVAFQTSALTTVVVVVAGLLGMFVDSILGATVEGRWIQNQAVNFLATFVAGLFAASAASAIVG